MATSHATGSEEPVETGLVDEHGTKDTLTVTVEGLYADLESEDPADHCPEGYAVDTYGLASTVDGMGKLTIRCISYDADEKTAAAVRTTFQIDMEEVQYDLEDHPKLAGVRGTILKWLATDEAKRVDGEKYYYANSDDELTEIVDETALLFCAAYMAGIKTFNRYYPVIEEISTWKNPPGLTHNGTSFSGGTPTFSSGIGTYATPPLTLSGYDAAYWYKSKDSWEEQGDKTWRRVEQWTYTPEGSTGSHAWIYKDL